MKTKGKTQVVKSCQRCGVEKLGEYNQFKTCRNTEACKRRAESQVAKPSPLPLNVGEDGDIFGHDGVKCVALVMDGPEDTAEAKALAALIVRAVNAHSGLVEMFRALIRVEAGLGPKHKSTAKEIADHARAALRAAGEEV